MISEGEWKTHPEVEHVHFFGWYIGNYPDFQEQRIIQLSVVLNNA
jgi:CDP-6-deoxy-D-xylo-4-hexulose-3-dehydrase